MGDTIRVQLHAVRAGCPTLDYTARIEPKASRSLVTHAAAQALGLRAMRSPGHVSVAGRIAVVPVGVLLVTADGHMTEPLVVGVSDELVVGVDMVLGADWVALRG